MMTQDRLRTTRDVRMERLEKDPEFREYWERTALARAVALRLIGYRIEHNLTQTQLAKTLGMRQPAIARLEAGEHNPSLDTLLRLYRHSGDRVSPTRHPDDTPFPME